MADAAKLQKAPLHIWLDSSANSNSHSLLMLQKNLETKLVNFKTFNNMDDFRQFIQIHPNENILLLVSDSYGRRIVPEIHNSPRLLAIYVWCSNKKTRNEEWTRDYDKIECVSTDINDLVERILSKYPSASMTHSSTSPSVNPIAQSSTSLSADSVNQDILWFRLFIEILIRMNDTIEAKDDMVRLWRERHGDNPTELSYIRKFEQEFQPSHAIMWYNTECAVYRLLGKAAYSKHYDDLYALRFIIKYLYLQLQEEHQLLLRDNERFAIRVYRGLSMSCEELERLKTGIGSLYSSRTMFSSSQQRDLAYQFAKHSSYDATRVSVIFQATAKGKQMLFPYADVSKLTRYPNESEVLFMLGTVFRVNSIDYDETSELWIVNITLCGEDDPCLADMVDYMKHEIKDTTDLVTLADLFVRMGEYDKAKEYYYKFQTKLPVNDPNIKRAWAGLSNLADIEGNYYISTDNYANAHKCFNEQLKLCRNLPSHHPQYGKCYENIANLYELEGQNRLALENLLKANEVYTQSLPAYHPDITKVEQAIENLSPQTKRTTSTSKFPSTLEAIEAGGKTTDINLNLETFLVVWLDANVNKAKDNKETYDELRSSINYIEIFEDLSTCQEYIEGVKGEKIVLIVSGRYGKEIVPRIHNLPQVNCIYVYCADKALHEEWTRNYSKIQSVIVSRRELIKNVTEDQRIRNLTEDPVPMSIINHATVAKETTAKDISKEMGSILWFQLLIEGLLRMPHTTDAKMELLQTWRDKYSGNSSELSIIDEFEHQFKRDKAVWWYTRESSLYRILNKALREQSIDIIFAFRFFLTELSKQVSKLYDGFMNHLKSVNTEDNDKFIIHVYRGQVISKEEFEQMQANVGSFISINSFFSTSRSKKKAQEFAMQSPVTDHVKRVLFRIQIDLRLPTKPFANIEGISYYPKEREILFMLGSIFRINNITYNEQDALWILNLNLCSEDDFELKELFAYLKKDIGEETSMVTLGNILVQMGEYDKAEQMFLRINHREGLIQVEVYRGNFYLAMKNYEYAIDHYEQALKLRREFFPASHQDIGKSYNEIALAFELWKKYPQAIDYYQCTIEQYNRTLKDNHPLIIQTRNSLQKLQRRKHH